MSTRRTRSITAKVTNEEYARLQAVAGAEKMSPWARAVLLHASTPESGDHAILAELIALRTILVNLHFTIASGQPVTAEEMRALIERADRDKWSRATDRLGLVAAGGPA